MREAVLDGGKAKVWSFLFFDFYLMNEAKARLKYEQYFNLQFLFERDSFKALHNMPVKVKI